MLFNSYLQNTSHDSYNILSQIDNGAEVVRIVQDLVEPMSTFDTNCKPANLPAEEKKARVNTSINVHEIQLHVSRKHKPKNNLKNIIYLI